MKIGMAYFEFGGNKGVARAAAELTTRIAAIGHDVHFHCAVLPNDVSASKIHFHKVRATNSFDAIGLATFALSGRASLMCGNYDVTHSHGNIVGADIITAHSCHKAGMKILRASQNAGAADRIRLFLEKKTYGERRHKKVLAVSEGVKRELMVEYNVPSSNIEVIPNGVDCERFTPQLRETVGRTLRDKLKFTSDDFLLIFVGNEFERKGLKHAIIAMSLLKKPNIKLLVIGNDNPTQYIAMATQWGLLNRIRFIGAVQNIEDYFAMSDAFIFPTLYEAFSLATLEAAASGVPLITTKVNGTEELIEEGINGFFIERHADDIAAKVVRLVDDAELRNRLGTNARISAECYSWDIITQRTIEVYEKVRR